MSEYSNPEITNYYYYRQQLMLIMFMLALSAVLVACNTEQEQTTSLPTIAATAMTLNTDNRIDIPATNTPYSQPIQTSTSIPTVLPTSTVEQPEFILPVEGMGELGALTFNINGSYYSYPLNNVTYNTTGQPQAPDGAEFALITAARIDEDGANTFIRLFTTHNYEPSGAQLINEGLQEGTQISWTSYNNGIYSTVETEAGWSGTMPLTPKTYTSDGLFDYLEEQGVELSNAYGFILTCGTDVSIREDLGGGSFPEYYHIFIMNWPEE